MAIVGGLFGILTYLLVIGVIGGILYFVVKAAVKEGMLDALEEWHKEHDGDGSFQKNCPELRFQDSPLNLISVFLYIHMFMKNHWNLISENSQTF